MAALRPGRRRPRRDAAGTLRLGGNEQRTILFLDEIHRFNKAQQDALLPAVEDGLVTLIGATTENPYFEVNSALLSRTAVYQLEPLDEDELREVARRGAAALGASLTDDVESAIARRAGGDARAVLNTLELAWQTAQAEGRALEERHIEDAARKRPLRYDKGEDQHYDFVSRSSSRCAAPTPTPPSTTWRPCSRAARTRASSPAAWSSSRLRTSATPTRARSSSPSRRAGRRARRPAGGAAQPRAGGDLPRPRAEVERLGARRLAGP